MPRRKPRGNRNRRMARLGSMVDHIDVEEEPPMVYHVPDSWIVKKEKVEEVSG